MYFCHDCGKQFQAGLRINGVDSWRSYLADKRTVLDLSSQCKCSGRTIRRGLKLIADSFVPSRPTTAMAVIDTTYFSRLFGVMLFQNLSTGRTLYRTFERDRTNADYLDGLSQIDSSGMSIETVVCDGHMGLLQIIGPCPGQMCQFH